MNSNLVVAEAQEFDTPLGRIGVEVEVEAGGTVAVYLHLPDGIDFRATRKSFGWHLEYLDAEGEGHNLGFMTA